MPFTLDPCNSQWTCSEQELRDRFNLCCRSPTGRPRWLGPEFGSDADRQLQPHTAPRRERQWRLEAAVLPWFRPHDRVHPWAGGSFICTICTSGFRRARHGTERGRQQAVLNTHPQGLARRARQEHDGLAEGSRRPYPSVGANGRHNGMARPSLCRTRWPGLSSCCS